MLIDLCAPADMLTAVCWRARAGLVRGSKHWPFAAVERMWQYLLPLLRRGLARIHQESAQNWGECISHCVVRTGRPTSRGGVRRGERDEGRLCRLLMVRLSANGGNLTPIAKLLSQLFSSDNVYIQLKIAILR